jgi:hypothetical protein
LGARHACASSGRRTFFRKKTKNREYRELKVSLVIGGSVTAFLAVRRSRRPVKPPARLSQPPLAETLFFLVVDDREGVEAADLDSLSWLIAVRLSGGPRAISHHRWFQHYGSNGLKVDRILASALRKRALTDHPVPLQHYRN